ncbi:integrin alpha [Holotrichia oblita]|uniref:Integrin alpha n=1 Tax=Holotrichia oblita TaxID=644536 RepID=A0ACB9T4V3_HOLOL|nr:integrin alpha [Holotrichia oblita]
MYNLISHYNKIRYKIYNTRKVVSQSLVSRPASFHTIDGSATDDDSYLGYSVAVGNFTGEAQEGIAAGMPRGGGLLGKILLYTWNLTNFMNITGRQMGSYFGYAVAAADVDGDYYDDLIIGAPLFTEPNNEGKYEVGKVYVVYQRSEKGRFKKLDELDGVNSKSRFGLSLTSLGDINLDGYTDFAVGAPYDGKHGKGAVYIFHGSRKGVQQKYTQVIYAEEVAMPPPSTFGFSLAGGLDLDQNAYPDTVVGSYLSDMAFFLRSKPVVKVTGYAQFQTLDKEIALEDKHCFIRGQDERVPVACTVIDTCLNYTGVGVPKEISLQLHFTLDTQKKKDIRMFFLEGETPLSNTWDGTWRLSKDSQSRCNKRTVYIKNDIRDKLTPLDVEVTYSMDTQHYYTDLPPVLDLTSKSLKKDSISVRKNCGADNICVPDLALEVKPNVERYLLASNEVLYFDITVSNNNEDSFETTFSVQIPEDVNFTKVEDSGDVKITCREISSNYTIVCDIGNPLPAQKIVNFKMFFKPHYKEGMKRFYTFNMQVDSANPEDPSTSENNKRKIELPIWVNSRLELKGASRPSEVHYNWTFYAEKEQVKHEREIGPQVIHLYTVTNNGPSAINEAEVLIFWPYATTSGDDLMYLLEPPHTLGNVRCEGADFNYQGYFVERRNKTIWETFDIDVSKEVTSVTSVVTKTQGGVVIEENEKKFSASSEDSHLSSSSSNESNDKFEKATGDASEILKEREEQRGHEAGATIGSHSTLLTSGQGSKVTKTETFTNSSKGPGGAVYTYTKNTTITVGPHGEVIRNETSYYGNQQNLRRSNAHPTAEQQVRDHTSSSRGSVRLSTDEVYEPPYSSVEYEVAEPGEGYERTVSSHNEYDNRDGHYTQHRGGAGRGSYQQGTRHYEGSQYHSSQNRGQNFDGQGGHAQYSGHYQGSNQNLGEQNGLDHTAHSYTYNKSYGTHSGQPTIKAATFGQGGKVEFLDLGVIGNNDQSLLNERRDTQLTGHDNQHGRYDPDLGRIVYDRPQHQSGYNSRTFSEGTSAHYGSGENQNYNSGKSHQTSHSEAKWSHSASQEYNSNTERDQQNAYHNRKKRQTKNDYDLAKEVACKATKCKFIKCYVGPMRKDEDATIAIRTRINANTLKNISSAHNITFSTMMVGRITNVPFIGIPSEKETVKYEIGTKVIAQESDTKPDVVPLWVVVLSAVAGALILLLLIFLFYKVILVYDSYILAGA